MKQYKRSDRLSEQIRRDISQLLERELAEQFRGMVTFTRVKLSDDLRYAKIFYSYLGVEENLSLIDDYFKQKNKQIRSLVGKNLSIRHIPEMTFVFDPSIEEGIKIERLLNEIKRDNTKETDPEES
ncbi:MAG: 30S ribosome-binding factor RbfA [Candidatus Zixiibacteriota bacterium]